MSLNYDSIYVQRFKKHSHRQKERPLKSFTSDGPHGKRGQLLHWGPADFVKVGQDTQATGRWFVFCFAKSSPELFSVFYTQNRERKLCSDGVPFNSCFSTPAQGACVVHRVVTAST